MRTKKKRLLPLSGAVFVCILLLIFCACCIFAYCSIWRTAEPELHAEEDYEKWGISISDCDEQYFVESDHSAFNEGFRYSILSGYVSIGSRGNNTFRGEIATTTGNRYNEEIASFLLDVWIGLDIPTEKRFSLEQCNWTHFRLENGSQIIIAKSRSDSLIYVAEVLL